MRTRILAAVVGVAGLAVASCDRSAGPADAPAPAAPAAPAFSHAQTADLSGYYMPLAEVRIGRWSFDHVFFGQTTDFAAWEGGTRSATFAPVMLQFDDVTSPMVQTELGEARSVTARVLPTAYSVSDTHINFQGRSPELGLVRFDGVLDPGALATSRRNLGDEGVVVTGSLKIGAAAAQNVRLRWWAGD